MKTRLLAAFAGIVLAFGIVGFIDANARTLQADSLNKDSIIVVQPSPDAKPIFSGNENNKVDSLVSVADALNDSTLKGLIQKTATEIKNRPEPGSPWTAYVGWIAGIGVVVYQGFLYVRKRLRANATKK